MSRFICVVLLQTALVPVVSAGELDLRIEPAKLTIRRFEPIFLRVTIENPGTESFRANAPPTVESGIVKVQLRRKGRGDFKRIPALNENLHDLAAYRGPVEQVPARSSRTTGIVLVEANSPPFFDESGEFEIQVLFADGKEYPNSVATMELHVEPIAQSDWNLTEETASLVAEQMISGAGTRPPSPKALRTNLERLPKNGIARFGQLLGELATFRDSMAREDTLTALNNIAKLRANCSFPERDWIAQRMGELYLRHNLVQLAREEIERLPTHSLEKERFERRLLLLPR